MGIDTMKKIIEEMRAFNLPYTVCFGGSGEPADHLISTLSWILSVMKTLQNSLLLKQRHKG
jgi:hypothetical protein